MVLLLSSPSAQWKAYEMWDIRLSTLPSWKSRSTYDTYRKLKLLYDRYKASKEKKKFLRGFESEIILFEEDAMEIKKDGISKLHPIEKLKAEIDRLVTHKTNLQAELQKIQHEEKVWNDLSKYRYFIVSSK
ncbi:MAG: hypothetical protein DBY32_02610 [Phascolarctobacterium sp.]|nr:MAG: hypothetical protein DBY32_02610 [Phascolarctobacterium sp.]